MAEQSAPKAKRKGTLQGMNINIPTELSEVAKNYFRVTRHKTLSRFVTEVIRREFHKDAEKIKALGYKLPDWVFEK